MKRWTDWEEVRHQVSIGGRVVDANGRPASEVRLSLSSGPKQFDSRVAGAARAAGAEWEELRERLDRTTSRADGTFFFLDLPAGRYTVRGMDTRSGVQDEKAVSVARKSDGKVTMAVVDLSLSGSKRK